MLRENFQFCCGAAELGNLDYDADYSRNYKTVEERVDLIKQFMGEARDQNKGSMLATTITKQRNAIKALKECGFQRIKRFQNPNTGGTWVSLWFRDLNKPV